MRKLIALLILLIPSIAFSTITLTGGEWSSTLNCSDWTQTYGEETLVCDGLKNNAANQCGGQLSRVNSSGNNASGGGYKGFRIYICPGTNASTDSLGIILASPVSEVWFRWYARYPSGFSWTELNYHKWIYFSAPPFGNSPDAVIDLYGTTMVSLYDQEHGIWHNPDHGTCSGTPVLSDWGWTDIMGGSTGDGLWHYFEFHVKTDTNGSNGIFEFWIDGVKRNSHSDVNFSGRLFGEWAMGVNQTTVGTGGWWDLDDIAISTTGYLGPLSNGVPVLITPIDNATAGWPVDFTWEVYSGSILFQLQVDDNSDFSSPEIDDATIDPDDACDETDCHYIVEADGELAYSTHYYWRVRALR